jgi:hypothetical protein
MIFLTFFRTLHEVFVEAQDMRREAHKRHRFVSDWE